MAEAQNQPGVQQGDREFHIARLYVKDLSYEAPHAPKIFRQEYKPKVEVDLQTAAVKMEDDFHEVVLTLTVINKIDDAVAFIVELKHAGVFSIKQFPENEMDYVLGAVCPNIIFPYAREVISEAISRGGFPQLYLAPVNFDALYRRQQQEGGKGGEAGQSGETAIGDKKAKSN